MVVQLELTDDEARKVHAALSVTHEILDQVTPGEGAQLVKADREDLALVARRLDHERRHKGAVANPNGPAHVGEQPPLYAVQVCPECGGQVMPDGSNWHRADCANGDADVIAVKEILAAPVVSESSFRTLHAALEIIADGDVPGVEFADDDLVSEFARVALREANRTQSGRTVHLDLSADGPEAAS